MEITIKITRETDILIELLFLFLFLSIMTRELYVTRNSDILCRYY
jgi:hypothetical protein